MKNNNMRTIENGEMRAHMVLDNKDSIEVDNTKLKDVLNGIEELKDIFNRKALDSINDDTEIHVKLISSDGRTTINSKKFNIRYDEESNELVLFNFN